MPTELDTQNDDLTDFDFSLDVAGLDTARPVLPEREYEMKVVSVIAKPNKAQTGANLLVTFATREKHRSSTGDEVPAGFKVDKYYPLQPNPEKLNDETYDPLGYKKDLTILFDACNPDIDASSRPNLTLPLMKAQAGKFLIVPLGISKDPQFGNKNEVKSRGLKPIVS